MTDSAPADTAPPSEPAGDDGRFDFETLVAFVMVAIALLGAGTTYRATDYELEAVTAEQRLIDGHVVEITERQQVLAEMFTRSQLSDRLRIAESTAVDRMQQAERMRPQNPLQAQWFELLAQEEFAVARALTPLMWAMPSHDDGKLKLQDQLQREVAERLTRYGFPAEWRDPSQASEPAAPVKGSSGLACRAVSGSSMWLPLEREIAEIVCRVPRLAFVVVIFVGALVLLTFADLATNGRIKRGLFLTAIGLGAIALAAVTYIDTPYRKTWIVVDAACLLALIPTYRIYQRLRVEALARAHAHFPHLHGREGQAAALTRQHGDDPFSQAVIAALAMTVLFSAITAYWYSATEARGDAATRSAFQNEVEMARRAALLGAVMNSEAAALAKYLENAARRTATAQRVHLAESSNQAQLAVEHRIRLQSYDRMLRADGITRGHIESLDTGVTDTRFPRRLFRSTPHLNLQWSPWVPFGLWDAAKTVVLANHHKAARLLGTLTLFAIAVYLFGQALSMTPGWSVYGLVGTASLLSVSAMLLATITEFHDDERAPVAASPNCKRDAYDGEMRRTGVELAADHYALGRGHVAAARNERDYRNALHHLECAVEIRPDFAFAQHELSQARARSASVEMLSDYVSLTKVELVASMLEAKEQALQALRQRDLQPWALFMSGLGYDRLLYALSRNTTRPTSEGHRLLLKSLEAAQEAVARDDGKSATATEWFNLGLAQLALERWDDALESYERGAREGAADGPEWPAIASAFTDLELLGSQCLKVMSSGACSRLRNEITRLKPRLVQRKFAAQDKHTSPRVRDFEIRIYGGGVWAGGTLDGGIANPARVGIMWYHFEPGWKSWRALQDLSDMYVATVERDGTFAIARSKVRSSSAMECLQPGRYRAELFIDGELRATSKDYHASMPTMTPARIWNANLQLCRPAAWQTWVELGGEEVIGGFFTPVGLNSLRGDTPCTDLPVKQGCAPAAFVFSYYAPSPPTRDTRQRYEDNAVRLAMQSLTRRGLAKGDEPLVRYSLRQWCANLPNNAVLAGPASSNEGFIDVVLVFTARAPGTTACEIVYSTERIVTPADWRKTTP